MRGTREPKEESIGPESGVEPDFKVQDRRHWTQADESEDIETAATGPARPGILDEYRVRAETAERKLLEYIEAFKVHQLEQEASRERMHREMERQVGLRFADLVGDLLPLIDDLERSLAHAEGIETARPLARGVTMARDRFLAVLTRQGVERIDPNGEPFDPVEAEAVRVDCVERKDQDGHVIETLQAGYRLGDRVLRAAQVVVGRCQTDG